MPGEADLGVSHLPVNHWLGVQVFSSSAARAKQQLAIPQPLPNHPCCYSSAADVVWSSVASQLNFNTDPQHVQSTTPAKAAAGSLAVYTHPQPIRVTTEVSGMILTSDVPKYTRAALQLLSLLRHQSLHTPATPQLPAAVGDTQVSIFNNAQPAGCSDIEGLCLLEVQYTVALTTRWFETGTSVADAAPPPTAVALQPLVQWTDLVKQDVLLFGMCLIEDTLVGNESFTAHTDGADLTGQCTLPAQFIDHYFNHMSGHVKLSAPELAKHWCMLLQTLILQ